MLFLLQAVIWKDALPMLFVSLIRKGPQLPGLPRNPTDKKCLLELRSFEHGIAKNSQNCQRYPPFILLALPPTPHYKRTEKQKPKRKERDKWSYASETEIWGDCCWSPSPSSHIFATQRQRMRMLPGLFSFFVMAWLSHSEGTVAFLRTMAAMESKRAVGPQVQGSNWFHCHSY